MRPRVSLVLLLLLISPVIELRIVDSLKEVLGHMGGTERERLLSVSVRALLNMRAAGVGNMLRRLNIPWDGAVGHRRSDSGYVHWSAQRHVCQPLRGEKLTWPPLISGVERSRCLRRRTAHTETVRNHACVVTMVPDAGARGRSTIPIRDRQLIHVMPSNIGIF